ncbi:hypothetical protein OS493_010184 [Desmophyllum pertusum]|uniref:Uncharacterized protein n=1 Tax=Desmophyllum pertusum TaxID=174260 RepID=A0A9W9YI12_9CNID|nr:hypothetical protein OS493_010184 [Desmophyllum pertusum]
MNRCFEPALAKKPSLPRDGNKDAPQSSTTVQGTSSNTARSSKESKTECKSQLQTEERNQKKQQITKDGEPVVNNLANITTASPPCKNSLEFRNIQAEENENCSDSSSEENKTASDSFKIFKYTKEDDTHAHPADKSPLEKQMTAQSPRNSFSAGQPGCKERENISKGIQTKNVPRRKV